MIPEFSLILMYRTKKYARKGSKTRKSYGSKSSRRVAYAQTPNKKRSYSRAFAKARPTPVKSYSRKAYSSKPRIVNMADGKVVIKHSEYIEDVPSSVQFLLATYALNPGMEHTFPWLCRVAQNFEEWSPRSMYFEFRTTSSDTLVTNSTSPALGQISMATQYNALDDDFQNNIQLLNYEKSATTKPSRNLRHYIDCRRRANVLDELYIRTGPIPDNADLRLYDLGKTSVSAAGMQVDAANMGQLWICYEIELRKPKIQQEPAGGLESAAHFKIPGDLVGQSFVKPFGNPGQVVLPTITSNLQTIRLGGANDSGQINFGAEEAGLYLVVYNGRSTNYGITGTFAVAAVQNCAVAAAWSNNTQTSMNVPPAADNEYNRACSFIVQTSGNNAVVGFSWTGDATVGPLGHYGDIYVSKLPNTL